MAQRRVNGYGVVKAVPSGDTLVLMGAPAVRGGIPSERTVVFTGINAPRFARGKNHSDDEPYAWEAREFTRKKCIGQLVSFNVGHSAGEREYGNVFIGDENLGQSLVKAGLARVKEAPQGAKVTVERENLQGMEAEAKAAGLGLWSKSSPEADHVRNIDWQPSAEKLFDRFAGKPLNCVVSQLRNGSTLRCEVPGSVTGKTSGRPVMIVTLSLAGAACSRVPFNNVKDGEEKQAPEPFSMEANHWVEARLLNRDVQIVIHGLDKTDNVYGDVLFPKGNVTSKLLELGLAKFVPWTASMSPNCNAYAAAAKTAQIAKRGLGAVASDAPEPVEMFGKVTFVQSGDTVVFVNEADNTETKFSLASIKCQRPARRGGDDADAKSSAFAFEAKEFLRNRLIGKKDKVRAVVEFTRTLPNGEARASGSLYVKDVNMSLALCQAGLAEVVRHGFSDPRAADYGKLIAAERHAVKTSSGMFGKGKAANAIVDLTDRPRRGEENEESKMTAIAAQGSTYLLGLKKEKNGVPAVVEYCFSGSRFKLYIPKERILVSFVLSGVRTPNAKDPFGPEATEFTRSRCLQRNVRVEIEAVDRACNFIGNLFFGPTNLATALTEEGFASIFGPSADRSPYCDDFYAAQAKAQEAKLNIWKNYIEKAESKEDGEDETSKRVDGSQMDVKITEITDAGSFCVQRVDDPNVAKVEAAMEAFNASPPSANPDAEWKKGKIVAGLFCDGLWYRVRLEGITATGEWRAAFIDYGNADLLEQANLRDLPEELAGIPSLAKTCFLAGIRGPTKSSEHFEDAAMTFNELAFDRVLSAKVECVDKSNKWHLTLRPKAEDVEDGDTTSINQILLREGWCRLVDRPEFKLKSLVNEFKKDEDAAKKARYNIWEYGDVSDEESEDEEQKKKIRFDGR